MNMKTQMQIAATIEPPEWMTDPSTQTIMNILNQNEENALFVGGCVRNALLNTPVFDIDIACKFTPQHTMKLLKHHDVHVVETGIKFGTITAIKDNKSFEITSLRSDINPTGRHSDVKFSKSWKKDAHRRDFTINALYADKHGNIFDPLDLGINDIKTNTVRFIGDPATRIQEDHLRILRFFRFTTKFSTATDQQSFTACKQNGELIHTLSSERIFDEITKILNDNCAPQTLELMQQANIFAIQDKEITTLSRLINLQEIYKSPNIYARYSTVKFIKKYIKNNAVNKFIKKIHKLINCDLSITQTLYKYDRDIVIQALLLNHAINGTQNDQDIQQDIQNAIHTPIPTIPFKAGEIMDVFKLDEGPIVGKYFREAERIWLDSDCTASRTDVFKEIRSSSIQMND